MIHLFEALGRKMALDVGSGAVMTAKSLSPSRSRSMAWGVVSLVIRRCTPG